MEVRPATRKKLGAIIVGEGFNITEDGVLSVEEQNNYVEFSRKDLIDLFRASKRRRR